MFGVNRMYDVNLSIDNLERLFEGSEALDRVLLEHHSRAAVVCLQKQGHSSPKKGKVAGDWSGPMSISWKQEKRKSLEKGWDDNNAIEWGATMIALSLVAHENYRVMERAQSLVTSKEEGGFDYWLENDSNNSSISEDFDHFNDSDNRVKLEISGILKGTEGRINRKIKERVERIQASSRSNIGAIILVVEFSNPKARVCQIR